MLSNFQGENSCDRNQLEAEVKSGGAFQKGVSGKFSEIGAGTEEGTI